MAGMTLEDLSGKMSKIDFGMLSTRTEAGAIASRPMSNNGEVAYRGDSFFFSDGDARTVSDIEGDARVGLTFTGSTGLLGGRPLFISVEGEAELIRDKSQFAAHWTKDLDAWFEQGIDTPGLVMIHVHANRIHYWNGKDEGEVAL
ncbi:pyridoxamine 5'-phosphate oxidase family protein [Consotaella salsifontis]|uniref:General stress protein 26 n=1 Tax=Consotaella salsifontis TaxID=1365950 RepID=A0A1T4RPE1_9HYPH|nr:pyridoxamine 5'-phosphate oxidase family protein [Consotaella salsifontis]SKA17849.1 General stress protein 26 [Consotaella salsifontis]